MSKNKKKSKVVKYTARFFAITGFMSGITSFIYLIFHMNNNFNPLIYTCLFGYQLITAFPSGWYWDGTTTRYHESYWRSKGL